MTTTSQTMTNALQIQSNDDRLTYQKFSIYPIRDIIVERKLQKLLFYIAEQKKIRLLDVSQNAKNYGLPQPTE